MSLANGVTLTTSVTIYWTHGINVYYICTQSKIRTQIYKLVECILFALTVLCLSTNYIRFLDFAWKNAKSFHYNCKLYINFIDYWNDITFADYACYVSLCFKLQIVCVNRMYGKCLQENISYLPCYTSPICAYAKPMMLMQIPLKDILS